MTCWVFLSFLVADKGKHSLVYFLNAQKSSNVFSLSILHSLKQLLSGFICLQIAFIYLLFFEFIYLFIYSAGLTIAKLSSFISGYESDTWKDHLAIDLLRKPLRHVRLQQQVGILPTDFFPGDNRGDGPVCCQLWWDCRKNTIPLISICCHSTEGYTCTSTNNIVFIALGSIEITTRSLTTIVSPFYLC